MKARPAHAPALLKSKEVISEYKRQARKEKKKKKNAAIARYKDTKLKK
jgi:hypothetical protein